jgi:rhodanese-related sulfurtransferase/rubrerythrin
MKWREFLTPVKSMDTGAAKVYIADHREGTFTLLDVRQPGEYEKARIPGAKLIPLPELTDRLKELDPDKPIIAYCAVGGRSRAAVQLLAGKGFKNVFNLKGGIKAWQGITAAGPADMGMDLLKGDEGPDEIILIAYGMEQGLGSFYSAMAERVDDIEVADLFKKLSEIEEKHKKRLLKVYISLDQSVSDEETFESRILSDVMEGGFTTQEFLKKNEEALHTIPDVINIAMMLETQALDLYLRFSQKVGYDKSKAVLFNISEEEKSHLSFLGRMMDRKG